MARTRMCIHAQHTGTHARKHTHTHTHVCTQVNFWDVRVDRLMKKGRKAEDPLDLVWKPTHSVHLISTIGAWLESVQSTLVRSCVAAWQHTRSVRLTSILCA